MQINLFSGARRIAVVLALMVGGASGTFAWIANDEIPSLTYRVDPPLAAVRVNDCMSSNSRSEQAYGIYVDNSRVSVTLCFLTTKGKDGRDYLPVRLIDNGIVVNWVLVYSPEADALIQKSSLEFALPASDGPMVKEQLKQIKINAASYSALWSAIGCLVVWAVSKIIGWIVRGFLGIPMGKDFREEKL